MPIRAVVFDLDCTLTCRRSSLKAASRLLQTRFDPFLHPDSQNALAEALIAADNFGYRERAEFFGEIVRAACWRGTPAMDQLLEFWRKDFPTCAVAHGEAFSTLAQLRAAGLRLGLITNGHSRTQNGKIDHLNLRKHFDKVVVSGDLGIKKPDPRIFHHCVAALGVAVEETAYVGDHAENDILGATSAGLHAIWISTGGPWPAHLPEPERQIPSLSHLPSLLTNIDGA